MKFRVRWHHLSFIVLFAVVCVGIEAWYRIASTPSKVTLDDLEDGDFVADRRPPFIPSAKLKQFVDRSVCIAGEVWFWGDGRVILTRPHETIITPLRFIICQPPDPKPEPGAFLGSVCATLRIRPQYDSDGRLTTVFYLENCRFEALP